MSEKHLAVLRQAADHVAKREFAGAKESLREYLWQMLPDQRAEDLQCLIFANALCSHLGNEARDANLYLRNYDVPQIRLFNLLATRFPPVTLACTTAIEILAHFGEGR